ncbi:hypothetical protein B0H17DRAFT_1132459 [Mycena rosella]|uniref:Uncharacterized protein n=1 Tax=Mycena rosella TaxID=1033263 RepID=A0AAD7DKU6_MYCRO|nr:hypothetical protein B0H17DRAFT_1132459 [Mycena rosella]
MNSAHGRVLPILLPSPELLKLCDVPRTSLILDPFPLGQERDLLEGQIHGLLDDEVRFLGLLHVTQITSQALEAVKTKVRVSLESVVGIGMRLWDGVLKKIVIFGACSMTFPVLATSLFTLLPVTLVLRNRAIEWTDPAQVRRLLERVKTRTEAVLLRSGVTKALEGAKNEARGAELIVNFLRAAQLAKEVHNAWVHDSSDRGPQTRRDGICTLAAGELRRDQLESILRQARELDNYSLPPDPDHLGSFLHPILSPSFADWFMQLVDDTDIVYASNALGRSEEFAAAAKANQKAIGQWHKTHTVKVYVDTATIERRSMIEAIREQAQVGTYEYKEILLKFHIADCPDCESFAIGGHNSAYHLCEVTGLQKQVTGVNFPTLEQVHYAHDILNNPHMRAALGDIADVLAQLDLVAVSVQEILDSPASDAILKTVLSTDPKLCTPKFLPADFDRQIAWSAKQAQTLETWFTSTTRKPDLYMCVCHGPGGYPTLEKPAFFLSTAVISGVRKRGLLVKDGRICTVCNNKKKCEHQEFSLVKTYLTSPHTTPAASGCGSAGASIASCLGSQNKIKPIAVVVNTCALDKFSRLTFCSSGSC